MGYNEEQELLSKAMKRKAELKEVMRTLLNQYNAVKKEIHLRKEAIKALERPSKKPIKITCDYLDTVKLDEGLHLD
jgi:hypothetical protein